MKNDVLSPVIILNKKIYSIILCYRIIECSKSNFCFEYNKNWIKHIILDYEILKNLARLSI